MTFILHQEGHLAAGATVAEVLRAKAGVRQAGAAVEVQPLAPVVRLPVAT